MGSRRKTHEEFKAQVNELGNGEYQLLSHYQNTRTKVLLKHVLCGNEYEVRPMNFLDGKRCPHCRGISSTQFVKKDTETFAKEVKDLCEGAFKVVGKYVNAHTKIEIKHVICKKIHAVRPTSFLSRGGYCVFCNSNHPSEETKNRGKKRKTTESFGHEVKESTNGEYRLISEYHNNRQKVKILHTSCGYEYEVAPNNFSRGARCPKCAGVARKTHAEFLEQVETLNESEYKVLSEYMNSSTPIKFKHLPCDSEFMMAPGKFLNGGRCTKCRSSKGENLIEKVLCKMSVNYTKQVKFESCKNINPLPFDFGILDSYGSPLFLIEYDGIQHYVEKEFFGGREAFIQRVRNDRIKSRYAKEKRIPLLRVRYDQKSPEKLLEHTIRNFLIQKRMNENLVA